MSTRGVLGIIHGPNLNALGSREPEIYGTKTLEEIVSELRSYAQGVGFSVEHFQSNSEGSIIDCIQDFGKRCVGLLINPGAYTHTSVAIRDAIVMLKVPVIEVHLSNIFAREDFRQHSYVSPVVLGVISGLGVQGYKLAIDAICARITNN